MDIGQLINKNLDTLRSNGVLSSKFELRVLMGAILKISPAEVFSYKAHLSSTQIHDFEEMIKKRMNHCPVDKIIGKKGFYKYDFDVNTDVLSPRPDTEILLEEALQVIKEKSLYKILDLGVGSGCIILSLLADTQNTQGVGVDISDKALEIAEKNAKNLCVDKRISFINASWFDYDFCTRINDTFDIIVSNPPYIPSDEFASLDKEVKDFDPKIALDGGKDGLRDYRQICLIAKMMLKNNGYLMFEFGNGQADSVKKIGEQNSLVYQKIAKDLNGIERCIIFKK